MIAPREISLTYTVIKVEEYSCAEERGYPESFKETDN